MISRMELARRAGIALNTLIRVEERKGCRPETRRRILAALDFTPSEKHKVFPEGYPFIA
jgi:DNA-binding LacI/PurR family transcriptional regulator